MSNKSALGQIQNLPAYTETSGLIIVSQPGTGCALGIGTYYVTIAGAEYGTVECMQIRWGTLLAATFTVESCNFLRDPAYGGISDYEASALANWTQENPSTAYVGIDAVNTALAGSSKIVWTALTGVLTAGVVGSSMLHLGNWGANRVRLKIVTTVGDNVRFNGTGKP